MNEEGFDEASSLDEGDIVNVDLGGQELECVILAIIGHQDTEFVMVAPRTHMEDGADHVDLLVAGWSAPDGSGEAQLRPIADEATYREVAEIFASMVEGEPDIA